MAERQATQRPVAPGRASTTAAVAAAVDAPSGPRSGFFRRLGAFVIDGVVLGTVYVALAFILQQGLVILTVANVLVDMAYYALQEGGANGQTLGKRALGIRVVDSTTGGRIGYGRGALRYLARFLSSLPLGLGYLWMVPDRENQTWHDKLASTVVVPASAHGEEAVRPVPMAATTRL